MRKTMKFGAAAAVFSAAIMVAGGANAAACPALNFGWSAGASPTFVEGCDDQDKRWQGISTNLTGTWQGFTDNVDVAVRVLDGRDIHFVEFKEFEEAGLVIGTTYIIRSSISVLDPNRWIDQVDLDSDGFGTVENPFSATIFKYVFDNPDFTGDPLAILTSIDSSFDVKRIDWRQQLWFEDRITVTGGGLLTLENSFRQVPEPGTLALLGIGLAGLAVARRRKQ